LEQRERGGVRGRQSDTGDREVCEEKSMKAARGLELGKVLTVEENERG
jgi:hypothetical protein